MLFIVQYDVYQTVNMLINANDKVIFSMQYIEDISPWRDGEKFQKYQGQLKEDFLDIPLITKLTTSSYLQISPPQRAAQTKIKRSSLLEVPLIGPTFSQKTAYKQTYSLSLPHFQLHSQFNHHEEMDKRKLPNASLPYRNSNSNFKRQPIYSKKFSSLQQQDLYGSIKEKMQSFIKIRQGTLSPLQNRFIRNKSQMLRSSMQPALKKQKNIVFQYSSISQLKKKETSPRKKKENHILDYLLEDMK